MRPLIGVIPLVDTRRDSLWMIPGYMDGIIAAGGVPVMLPLTEDAGIIERISESISGLLLTGGQDVDPRMYGQKAAAECGEICEKRDVMESELLGRMLELDKPVFGICRGIQFINAYLGGTLYQDLGTQFPSEVEHHMLPPYERFVHDVTIQKGTQLYEIFGAAAGVNSYHHQGVDRLATGLTASAYAPDGLVEAVERHASRFLIAVQWHPEWLYHFDEKQMKLLREFTAACSSR